MTLQSPAPARSTRAVRFLLLLAAVAATGVIGSLVTLPKVPTWYARLEKPFFTPPSYVFGPVWTALYLAMAVAAWRVWDAPAPETTRRAALILFALQLGLNAAWSPVFFGLERPGWALAVIVVLLAALLPTTRAFFRVDRLAGGLMLPYVAWVSYATALNAAVVVLNPR